MGNHAHNLIFLGAEMETTVPAIGETALLSLPLREQSVQGDVPGSEDPKVAVHGQNVFILLQGLGHTHRNGFLSNAAEPLGNLALSQQDQHFFLNHSGFEHPGVQVKQFLLVQVTNMIPHTIKFNGLKVVKRPHLSVNFKKLRQYSLLLTLLQTI